MKKFLAAFLTICFIIAIGVSAINLEHVEEIAEPAVPADAEQTSEALLNEQIIPGLNILTGTTEPYDFEDDTSIPSFASVANFGEKEVYTPESAIAGNATKMLRLANTTKTEYLSFEFLYNAETSRKYQVSFDLYSDDISQGFTDTFLWWFNFSGSANSTSFQYKTAVTEGNWFHAFAPVSNTNNTGLRLQFKSSKTLDKTNYYFDNISIVPYFIIEYYGLDGSVVETDQVLYDSDNNLLTSYKVKTDITSVPGLLGWSLTPGGEEPLTEVPLSTSDIKLYPIVVDAFSLAHGGSKINITDVEGDYVFPAYEESGLPAMIEGDHFYGWEDSITGTVYTAGTVISAADVPVLLFGKVFNACILNENDPAMGMAFEGDAENNYNIGTVSAGKYSDKRFTIDDGRTVLYLNQYKSTWGKDGTTERYFNDARVTIPTAESYDATQYCILDISYKAAGQSILKESDRVIKDLDESALSTDETLSTRIFYMVEPGVFYGSEGEYTVRYENAKSHTPDGTYQKNVYDLSVKGMTNDAKPFDSTGKNSGFAIDPYMSYYTSEVYLDYLRVYRKGFTTVTYDSNIPDYTTLAKGVDADTGRGIGTGYVLSTEKPVLSSEDADSYMFAGWALTPDATTIDEVVRTIDLKEDTTVYAVWIENNKRAPSISPDGTYSMQTTGENKGLRLRAVADVFNNRGSCALEYGFIVARADVVDPASSELTFNSYDRTTGKKLYVSAAAYDPETGKDIQYAVNTDGSVDFTALLVNIPQEHYDTKFYIRTYIKYGSPAGHEFYVYGEKISVSMKDVAQMIREAGGKDYENNKEFIDGILGA